MFITIKPKPLISLLLIVLISFGIAFALFKVSEVGADTTRFNYTIVLDAGHGGRDAGCSGINTGVKESELNLAITKKLEKYLSDFGFKVVLTRKTSDGLYSNNVDNYKKDDMAKRKKIIDKAKADLLISVHLNSYPSVNERGAQAFFLEDNEESEALATHIQKQLFTQLPEARGHCLKGDYYMLKVAKIPTSIVECGFLSSPDEEKLLLTDEYQQKIAYSIFCGIVSYFSLSAPLE